MNAPADMLAAIASPGTRSTPTAEAVPRPALRWRTRILVPGALLAGAGALLAYTGWRTLRGAIDVRVVPVIVKASDLPRQVGAPGGGATGQPIVQAPGWIEPDPYPTYVSALAEGVVDRVHFLEGDRVEPGAAVAQLNDESARIALAEAEAEVLIARAEADQTRADLEAAQAEWENPISRDRAVAVAEAELAGSHAELAEHDAEVALERARLAEIRDEHDRLSRSSELQAAAAGEFARVKLRLAAQERAIEALEAHRAVIESHLRHHEAELHAAAEGKRLRITERQALASAKAAVARAGAHVTQDEAKRDEAALRLRRMTVVAPVGGVVMTRLVEPGSRIMMISDDMHASHVARLYDPARLQVRVDIPLAEAARVGVGQHAEISTEALPDQVFRGVVTRRVEEANLQKNTVQVKVSIESPSGVLRPEMLARVRFYAPSAGVGAPTGPSAEAPSGVRLYVPRDALVERRDREAMAWVVDRERETATLRRVALGTLGTDDAQEVTDGLRPGDRLIVTDLDRLREGSPIRVVGEGPAPRTPAPSPTGGPHRRGHGS